MSENVAECLLNLPFCVDNPGFHEHSEYNSLQSRIAVREGKCCQVMSFRCCFWPFQEWFMNYYLTFNTHRIVAVVTHVISTNKKSDHFPV